MKNKNEFVSFKELICEYSSIRMRGIKQLQIETSNGANVVYTNC